MIRQELRLSIMASSKLSGDQKLSLTLLRFLHIQGQLLIMEDDEVAVITADQVQIFDSDRFLLAKEKHLIEWDVSAAEKGGYAHFMLIEMENFFTFR